MKDSKPEEPITPAEKSEYHCDICDAPNRYPDNEPCCPHLSAAFALWMGEQKWRQAELLAYKVTDEIGKKITKEMTAEEKIPILVEALNTALSACGQYSMGGLNFGAGFSVLGVKERRPPWIPEEPKESGDGE